ncbi:BolA family transcriptional regulator [Moraxella sp. ZY210820]|uniref:BolA family protein n=1 Tax=unclassified Moraxella TaxID=2685852 RepID=UPI002730ACA5|nr:BolA family protein [Moraxella sp. ZY210820]WLF83446.1 BolA family transcriptional regulator [Moraxella sp. ZY210820]
MSLQQQLFQQLQALNPQHIDLINESHQHGGYYEGKESHFKLIIVADVFQNLRPVQRHQKIYALTDLIRTGQIHALAIHAYTPDEWQGYAPVSPQCAHAPKV